MAEQDPHLDLQPEEALGKVYDGRLMRRLLAYVRPYRWTAAGAVTLIVGTSLLQLVPPLAVAAALDLYIAPHLGETAQGTAELPPVVQSLAAALPKDLGPAEGIAAMAGIHLVATLLTFVLLCFQGYLMQMLGQRIMFDLRQELFDKTQRLPVAYFDRNPIGRLVTRVTTDVASLNELFTAGLVHIFGDLVLLVGIVGVLLWLDWRLALISFSVLPLLMGLTFWFKRRARQRYRDVRVKVAAMGSVIQEQISGMSVLQLFNREGRAAEDFRRVNDAHRRIQIQVIFYYALYYPAVEMINATGIALLLWFGGGAVLRGALTLGALIAFIQYAQRFYLPIADLSEKYNVLQGAMASSERIFQVLDKPLGITSPEDPHRPAEVRGAVEFDRVDFAYLPDEPVLEEVSFRVKPGETLAVVGHTGAGKSTLANLLLRFYDVDSGAVTLDGVDLRRWHLPTLRRSFGMVLQDVFLFSGTVAGNLRLGETGISDEALTQAAREVHALEVVESLPGGFDAPVKERGAGLSVGQKQLLAFARALAFDPRILILDEATASVDTETEALIQQALERLLEGRTSIVIAHRLSTIQQADRILVMHKGQVREQGTHQELLSRDGIYSKLYRLQYLDQDAAPQAAGTFGLPTPSDASAEARPSEAEP